MTKITCTRQESAIVARSGGTEQLLKVTVVAIEGDKVTLDLEVGASESVHSGEEWARFQAARTAAKMKPGADRPKERAAYSD